MNFGVACKQVAESIDVTQNLTDQERDDLHDQSVQCFETAYMLSSDLVEDIMSIMGTSSIEDPTQGTTTTSIVRKMLIQSLLVLMFTSAHICDTMCYCGPLDDMEMADYNTQFDEL
jgi:hypothetical protein